MAEPRSYHMSPEEFRRCGHEVIDWIAAYMREVDQFPVMSSVKPGEIRAKLPDGPPRSGESFDPMLREVDEIVIPDIAHWQSPRFFGYHPCNNSGPSILGELLSAG